MAKEKDPATDQTQDVKVSGAESGSSAPTAKVKYTGPDYVNGIYVRGHLLDLKNYSVTEAQQLVERCPETAQLFKF